MKRIAKRPFLVTVALCAVFFLCAQTPAWTADTTLFHVTLLGTGVPTLNVGKYVGSGRVNTGLLIETGPGLSERLLFDCGQGIATRLLESGGADPINNPNIAVDKIFLSHLHSDHYVDLPVVFSYGWLFRNTIPIHLWGPPAGPNGPGTQFIANSIRSTFLTDITIRAVDMPPDSQFSAEGANIYVKQLPNSKSSVVYSNNGVVVTAFRVSHPPVRPSYGFRIDYANHSVVYSGDTNPKQNLIFNSQNVDLLIHEIYGWYRWVAPALFDYHTDPEGFAEVMNATKPKLAVMNHIAVAGNSDWGYDTTDKLVTAVRDFGYGGPLEVGQDLMTIDVTTSGIVSDRSSVPVGIEENTRGMLPELLRRVP